MSSPGTKIIAIFLKDGYCSEFKSYSCVKVLYAKKYSPTGGSAIAQPHRGQFSSTAPQAAVK